MLNEKKDELTDDVKSQDALIRQLWRRNERKLWMFALFFGSAALYSSRLILPVSSYYISKELQWDRKSTGIVLGSFFYGYMLTQYLGGYLADKYGGEKILTRAAFIWGAITLLFPQIPSLSSNKAFIFTIFLLCRGLLGIFQGFHFPSIGSLMAIRVVETERQFTYCFMSSGSHLGTLLCGSLGSFLMEYYGWRVSFYLIGILSLLWATFVSRRLLTRFIYNNQDPISTSPVLDVGDEPRASSGLISLEDKNQSAVFANEPKPITEPPPITQNTDLNWHALLHNRAFWAMLIGHFTHSNSVVIIISWLPSYFHDNFPDAKSWVFNVVPYLINIPSTLASGLIADYLIKEGYSVTFVRKLMTTIVLLGGGFCLLVMTHISNYLPALFWMAMAICCNGFHNSGILLNPQDLGPRHGGSIYGLMSMIGAIPGFAGVYLVGYILDTSKSWSLVFQCTGGFCIFGWVIYQMFGTGRQIV